MQAVALIAQFIQPLPVAHGKMPNRGASFEGRPNKGRLLDPDLSAVPCEPDGSDRSPAEHSADLDRFIYNDCHVTSIVNICSPVKKFCTVFLIHIFISYLSYLVIDCNIFQGISLHSY